MRLLFWGSSSLIVLAYVGYPVCIYLRARLWPCPVRRASICPTITILLAVRNEEKNLPAKLRNLAKLDYPSNLIEIIVISDGSMDKSNEILASWQNLNRRAFFLPEHRGKANALNYGLAEAHGEIICFTDARQMIDRDGLRTLVANFADASVGCVSGNLAMKRHPTSKSADGVGLYWNIEKDIRYWEALGGSAVGATGAFYAVRKRLIVAIPLDTILDDVYIPFQVVRQGQRVIFEPRAVVVDTLVPSLKEEFRRKVRTLVGNYQLLKLAPWTLTRSNPVRLQFVCHKLLRLVVPFALMGMLISTFGLRRGIYELAFDLQLLFYALATLRLVRFDWGPVSRLSDISMAFVVLNVAAAVAFFYFITGRKASWSGSAS